MQSWKLSGGGSHRSRACGGTAVQVDLLNKYYMTPLTLALLLWLCVRVALTLFKLPGAFVPVRIGPGYLCGLWRVCQ